MNEPAATMVVLWQHDRSMGDLWRVRYSPQVKRRNLLQESVGKNGSRSSVKRLAVTATAARTEIDCADRQIARGYALQQSGDLHNAVLAYQRAIQLEPGSFRAYNNLGMLFATLGDHQTALTFLNAAVALNSSSAEIHSNLGNVQLAQGQYPAALGSYREAIRIDPKSPMYYNHLGNGLRVAGDMNEAECAFRQALFLKPEYAEASVNLGFVLAEQGKSWLVEEHYRRALRWKPDLALAHVNLSQHLLRQGELSEGWEEAEWRWRWKQFPSPERNFSQPQWRGETLDGTLGKPTILLHAEQGFGDTLQMLRFIPLLAQRGARIVLEVPPELLSLVAPLEGVAHLLARGKPLPLFDWHCPLMSLPLAFSTTLETIPSDIPYLAHPHTERPAWLGSTKAGQLQVGIVWAGSRKNTVDHRRSAPLSEFAPLFAVEGVDFYSLQRGGEPGEAASSGLAFAGVLPESVDFAGTASALAHLDLVITVDTAVAHLAGALGRPVWILLPYVADWRWLLERADSPWYPTAKLFRQMAPMDWPSVLQRVAGCLSELSAQHDTEVAALSR